MSRTSTKISVWKLRSIVNSLLRHESTLLVQRLRLTWWIKFVGWKKSTKNRLMIAHQNWKSEHREDVSHDALRHCCRFDCRFNICFDLRFKPVRFKPVRFKPDRFSIAFWNDCRILEPRDNLLQNQAENRETKLKPKTKTENQVSIVWNASRILVLYNLYQVLREQKSENRRRQKKCTHSPFFVTSEITFLFS